MTVPLRSSPRPGAVEKLRALGCGVSVRGGSGVKRMFRELGKLAGSMYAQATTEPQTIGGGCFPPSNSECGLWNRVCCICSRQKLAQSVVGQLSAFGELRLCTDRPTPSDGPRPGKRMAPPSARRQHASVLGLDEPRYRLAGCIMTKDEEAQVREAVAEAFRQGCIEARAGMSNDLRGVIDYFNAEMRQLRREICKLAKLPMPPPLNVNGYEDGPLQ